MYKILNFVDERVIEEIATSNLNDQKLCSN